jgi:hypothetical protein
MKFTSTELLFIGCAKAMLAMDNRGLYITACTHVSKIRMKIVGVRRGEKI